MFNFSRFLVAVPKWAGEMKENWMWKHLVLLIVGEGIGEAGVVTEATHEADSEVGAEEAGEVRTMVMVITTKDMEVSEVTAIKKIATWLKISKLILMGLLCSFYRYMVLEHYTTDRWHECIVHYVKLLMIVMWHCHILLFVVTVGVVTSKISVVTHMNSLIN